MANIPVHGKIDSTAKLMQLPHSKSELQVSEDEGRRSTTMAQNFSQRAANTVEKLWLVKEMVLHGETAEDLSNLYGIGMGWSGLPKGLTH